MLLQSSPAPTECGQQQQQRQNVDEKTKESHDVPNTHMLDWAPAPGWTVHVTNDGRLYYCNHVTRTAGWLPPVEAWKQNEDPLPYGWERALDDSGRTYYINHVNKTTTYETPIVRHYDHLPAPEPRTVTLERSPTMGFGFVAGSEKPVIVRFVTEGGPSVDKLLPGDEILSVNGEDVKLAPREHVISLVRACTTSVCLVVCQPAEQKGVRKSTLLSASKKARLKNKPSRVRFAESVCVNGAPLFPPSAFSLGDLCVAPMANVLKVFLENGQTKSFKYDAWTTVQNVVTSLEAKLCLQATEHFSLVVEHIKSVKRNKLTLLDPSDTLARIASRPGAYKLRCLFRVAFVPQSAAALAQRDLSALDYLYTQCCNDVIQERFAPELQYETALRLAALHIYQHALANNIPASKLTVKTIEKEFGLERFVPSSLLENMKQKEVRKLIGHFLKLHMTMAGPGKQLTALQAKLHYLDIVGQLPSYGAKCFSAGPKGDSMERVILVSPKFGISQIVGSRNSVPVHISDIEDMKRIEVRIEDELYRTVLIRLKSDKLISVSLEERDASELVLVLKGYFHLLTDQVLPIEKEETTPVEDLAPPYLSQHRVFPEKWSYVSQQQVKTICFAVPPSYREINRKTNGLYNTVGRQSKPPLTIGLSLDSNMNSNISNKNHLVRDEFNSFDKYDFIEARNDEVVRRLQEMQILVENSEKYLNEQENLMTSSSEWQETSVDVESDTESVLAEDLLGRLKHSDSLLLLNKSGNTNDNRHTFANTALEMLRSEASLQSESDNDSLYTPINSPKRLNNNLIAKTNNRWSFGLHSPNNEEKEINLYVSEDIIDLTLIPPPATPDELDSGLPTPINVPPINFADSVEKLNTLGVLDEQQDLEDFLASVVVPPPVQKATPAVELTPEEILSYIIPPPPKTIMNGCEKKSVIMTDFEKKPVIEYATVERKGPFSCCSKAKKAAPEELRPLPRRSSDEKPPEIPPKTELYERQRSQSLTSSVVRTPPELPPKGKQHILLPPKKPPLPPVPPIELLRQRKNLITNSGNQTSQQEKKTAGIGSPHLQRSRNIYTEMDKTNGHSTAISTPTSPYLSRGAPLTAIPITQPVDQPRPHTRTNSQPQAEILSTFTHNRSHSDCGNIDPKHHQKNGCNNNLLTKTDAAMSGLLFRLNQISAQCTTAQLQGGGRLISEEKFQAAKEELTSQSLQLVTSSKMLVIAMSDPHLPDLPENLAICLTVLRRLTELCQDLANHTTAPLQTRNLVLKVHDVTSAFRQLITSDMDRSTRTAIEEHLAAQAEGLAAVLATLLRSLRVFSP